jgi:nitrous-oxide reductase
MMETAIKEGILFLIPEPKSPHGVDVTPDGKFITVAGKLDTHVSVYSFEKIRPPSRLASSNPRIRTVFR